MNIFLPDELKVDENELVINTEPTFFQQLEEVLNSTTKRTLANYLVWRVVRTTSGLLTSEFRKNQYDSSAS